LKIFEKGRRQGHVTPLILSNNFKTVFEIERACSQRQSGQDDVTKTEKCAQFIIL